MADPCIGDVWAPLLMESAMCFLCGSAIRCRVQGSNEWNEVLSISYNSQKENISAPYVRGQYELQS